MQHSESNAALIRKILMEGGLEKGNKDIVNICAREGKIVSEQSISNEKTK